ncbi:MAG TPA: hypothetical protein EYO59_01325, partial [Chromatiaceae bacterium]|nr:hypothetical protein [Chromatiaceae bacterium]
HVVFEYLRRKAFELGICDHGDEAKPGSVSVIQRFGSALNLNIHFHCLVTDGVFLPMDGSSSPEFFPLPGPKEDELEAIAWATCRKVVAKLKRLGFWQDEEAAEGTEQRQGLEHEENALNDSYEASIRGVVQFGPDSGRRVCRVFGEAAQSEFRSDKVLGRGQSFNVEAGRVVPANDRAGLERLVRYILRPPLSRSRLRERSDGQIEIKLKTAWSDGTTHIVLAPMDFMSRLAALVPAPKINLIRYHGVFAPASPLRKSIVLEAQSQAQAGCVGDIGGIGADACKKGCAGTELSAFNRRRDTSWASLMKRVFEIDVLECPKCKSRMQRVSFITKRDSIRKYLE